MRFIFVALALCLGVSGAERYVGKPLGALSQLQHGVRGRAFAVDARTIFLQDFHYDGEGPGVSGAERYVGKPLGALSQLQHGVRGRAFAVDARTIFLQDFHYDGEGPAAYFYVGTSGAPSATGATRLRDERGGSGPLRKYRGEGVALALPDALTLRDVRWFAVWCDEYAINFGDVRIPAGVEFPKPARVGALRGVHGVSSDAVVVVDAQTLLVPNFSYDGEAPDAKFWVGRGAKPSPAGVRIPDENGKEAPLRKYDRKTIVLTLPGELTVFDIGHFGVWCEAFTVDFGHVALPREQLANIPPSLKMLGVSPQSKLNCEVLYDELAFEVRWAVAGDSIVLQLVAKLEDGEYMSFGISGDPSHSQMVGGDVAVAWVDKTTLKGVSKDYYLDAKSQCAGVRGSCPDDRLVDGTDSIRLLNAALVNGYSIVTYQRSLKAGDELDLPVLTNASQPVIWAVGPLNSRNEVSYHHHFTKGDKFIEFGRPPVWNCPMPEGEEEHHSSDDAPAAPAHHERKPVEDKSPIKPNPVPPPKSSPKAEPWDIPAIQCYEPQDGVYYAQMGPTGGKQGYPAITGHVGWGISWYINGLLIPEVNVVRGRKYTFVVEGGNDPSQPARYHPFYITDDPVGGYFHKSEQEKQGVKIFAGVRRARSGELVPTGVGRLCNWTPDKNGPEADEYPSFGAYQRSLTLVCEEGSPGVVTWIPDKNTPDTVYYQCFTHRHLGWKINVVDECDAAAGEESRVAEQVVVPDLHGEESIQVHSRRRPDDNFLEHKRFEKIINTKPHYNDFSSDKAKPGSALYTTEYESPISSGQIKDVIDVVETLESSMKEQMRRNTTRQQQHQQYQQYQVTEDVRELLPEQAGDEYEVAARPNTYSLPPSQQPLTLQSVLRPNRPSGMRPPFRRPTPPEIKLRRPPTMHQKGNGGYPLPMPSSNNHGPKKPIMKYPNGRPQNRPPMSGIPLGKPLPPMHHHKPNYNQGPLKQVPKIPSGPVQSIIMGKPAPVNLSPPTQSQTMSLGKTDIIASHVVKSQITLPGGGDVIVAQHSAPQISIARPGQIILGKPMEHPVPLDQQMTPTKQLATKTYPTPAPEHHSSTQRLRVKPDNSHQNDMKSSDFIGESVETKPLHPAVNTGFKPDTIVVESGFKPIIREPLMAGEDRITDYDGANRREDTDVEEDYDEAPQTLTNHAYSSDKLTQSFEPMFIPSPPDRHLPSDDRTKEIFPSNHAKEDRPHPVYVKTETELNALFSKKNMEKEVPDMVMESDRVSPQYLPPDPKFPKEHSQKLSNEQTYTTYDGKTVSASTLVTVPAVQQPEPHNSKPFSSKVSSNSEFLLKTPQFGPFKGEIPIEVVEQLKTSDPKQQKNPTTHLKLVNAFVEPQKEYVQDLKAEGSEVDEVVSTILTPIDDSEYDDDEQSMEDEEIRTKRETKATQFERGEVEPQPPTSGISLTKNQVDFDVEKKSKGNAATTLRSTSLVLLILSLLRLL